MLSSVLDSWATCFAHSMSSFSRSNRFPLIFRLYLTLPICCYTQMAFALPSPKTRPAWLEAWMGCPAVSKRIGNVSTVCCLVLGACCLVPPACCLLSHVCWLSLLSTVCWLLVRGTDGTLSCTQADRCTCTSVHHIFYLIRLLLWMLIHSPATTVACSTNSHLQTEPPGKTPFVVFKVPVSSSSYSVPSADKFSVKVHLLPFILCQISL
jgi:hypothetical protein